MNSNPGTFVLSLIVHLELLLDGRVDEGAGGPGQLRHQLVVDGLEALAQRVDEVSIQKSLLALLAPVLGVVLDVDVRQRCRCVR